MAIIRPDDVTFCSRCPERKPTPAELKEMFAEMHYYYTTKKLANGPFILLDGIASMSHQMQLNIQEKLILYHEIGHFLNGDLFDSVTSQKALPTFQSNLHYQREDLADLVGFGLYLRELKYKKSIHTNNRHFAL